MNFKRIAEGVYALDNSPDDPLTPLVKEALQVLDHAWIHTRVWRSSGGSRNDEPVDDLILYTTQRQVGLSISFDGEKDCEYDIDKHHSSHFIGTVLLQLYAGAIAQRLQPSDEKKHIHSIYIPYPRPSLH